MSQLALYLFTICLSATAHAQRQMNHNGGSNDSNPFQVVVSGQSVTNKDDIFKRLLSTEDLGFDWPSFPRTWHEQSVAKFHTTNISVGLSLGWWGPLGIPKARFGGKLDREYRYNRKTSLIMILPRQVKATKGAKKIIVEPKEASPEMFVWDYQHQRALPNMSLGVPMVAMCAFEATYTQTQTGSANFDLPLVGGGKTQGEIYTISQTMFSKFFQVTGDMSAMQILDEVCVGQFQPLVAAQVEGDFAKAELEFAANKSSLNECVPATHVEGVSDPTCYNWLKSNFPQPYSKLAVARCELSADGHNRCQLRGRKGSSCPMSWDSARRTMIPSEETPANQYFTKATGRNFEFACDKGLKCVASSQPATLFGNPFLNGSAECR